MDKISSMPAIGWVVILIIGIIVIPPLFILLLKKGGKMSILGQTIEVYEGGKIQKIDSIGLMYLMKDNCEKIELLRKERIEDILPDLSYLLSDISVLACCMYRAESILNKRLYKNGFEELTVDSVNSYIKQLAEELFIRLNKEILISKSCTTRPLNELKKEKIYFIAQDFTKRVTRIYLKEVKSKADMYLNYKPLFEKIGDKIRADFCREKMEKKLKQAENLRAVLEKLTKRTI
ncbi:MULTISPECIES: hypothetical protein [Treponema]|uniref:hypothetical protein n=1 Tax=Treponema TaxID=157 RepID=UPI0002B5BAF2|nr:MULTISPECIES: hypothetical protein [Treponema]EMB22833.1 hypothetical protein HMPREF9724_01777 [Treponema denticola SP37]EPF32572.1 hypothetical protein HMPREF9734_02640 [Treponema denticola SP44]EPF40768.1 hypothetical protein HMPREF9731_00004 [Treponema denticola SP23]UTC77561.1 hypothetical protein E4O04_05905 [Treponema sp. OMZ 799]